MRVLVIDDDETFCRLLVEILESKGIETVWTTDGSAGYEMSTKNSYDLVIIDVRMPLVLGTDLAEALKKKKPQANIILVSAFPDEDLRKNSISLGAPLLSKPFSADRLLEAIDQTLNGSEHQNS